MNSSPQVAHVESVHHLANETILGRLKTETACQHEYLETRLDLLRQSFSLHEYTELLCRFYSFYEPWEKVAWPVLRHRSPSLVAGRHKVPLLVEDLRFFGMTPETISVSTQLPPLATFQDAAGSLYVLEGATLGGQILARHFARALGLGVSGVAFFRGYGESSATMWQSFRQDMIDHVTPAEEDPVVLSAVKTFQALTTWLLQCGGNSMAASEPCPA